MGKFSRSQSDTLRVLLVASLCVLVFSFALSSKLSLYRDGGRACDPLAGTKLCLDGAKMDLQGGFTPLLVLWLIALTVLIGFSARWVAFAPAHVSPSPKVIAYRSDWFPRPPPVVPVTRF